MKNIIISILSLMSLCFTPLYAQESCYEQYLREHNKKILTAEDADDSYDELKKAVLAKQMYGDSYLLMLDTVAQRAMITKVDGTYIADLHVALVDSTWYMWLSVDPLADKNIANSPYMYCNGNPIMLIDPDGRDWYQSEETQYYQWFEGNQTREGYRYIGGKGALLGNEKLEALVDNNLKIMSNGVGLYSGIYTFDIAPSDKGALLSSKERGWDFVDEFVCNSGPIVSFLMSNHQYTQTMMKDPMVLSYQAMIDANQTDMPGSYMNVRRDWNLSSVLNSANRNMAAQFIGSFRYDGFTDGGSLYNVISDSKNVRSLFYHLPFTGKFNGDRSVNPQGCGNTYQFYIWKR